MGHRHEDDGIAGKAGNNVRDPGPPPLTNLNQSPKSEPPPPCSLAADGNPPLPSAFISLGDSVAAVVLRLQGGFPKVKVVRTGAREDGTGPR